MKSSLWLGGGPREGLFLRPPISGSKRYPSACSQVAAILAAVVTLSSLLKSNRPLLYRCMDSCDYF